MRIRYYLENEIDFKERVKQKLLSEVFESHTDNILRQASSSFKMMFYLLSPIKFKINFICSKPVFYCKENEIENTFFEREN